VKWLTGSLLNERRSVVYVLVLGIWAEVFLYCVLHDQYLIRIAPEHFTEYHAPLWGIANHSLLAIAWAFKASIGPGLLLGLAAVFVGRAGPWPKIPVARMLKMVAGLIVVTELAGLASGGYAWQTGEMLYPAAVYPEETRPLITTQTIQLTCYLVGAVLAIGFLIWVGRWRWKSQLRDPAGVGS
jgi:hypothetical protein